MKLLLINSLFYLFVGINLANTLPAISTYHHNDKIELSIEKSRDDGWLLFHLTNRGSKEILTSPLGMNNSRILLILENGKIIEHYVTGDIIPTVLKPGETQTWRSDIQPMLEEYKVQEEKNLQLIWSVNGVKSAPYFPNLRH